MKLRLGTRGSKLALRQARKVAGDIEKRYPEAETEIVTIKTEGDRIRDRSLADIGGKGLFVKDIERALQDKTIDAAVHSLKDVPTEMPEGLGLTAFLEREDPRDVLITGGGETLEDLPEGAVLGTSSLRRRAQMLMLRPDLRVIDFRGNVPTRLNKLSRGECHATILAAAGLKRLNLIEYASQFFETDECIPAVGQGIVAVQSRFDDDAVNDILAGIDSEDSRRAALAERTFLEVLEGGCHAPIAAYAAFEDERLCLTGLAAAPDGSRFIKEKQKGDDPAALGRELGRLFLDRGAAELLSGA